MSNEIVRMIRAAGAGGLCFVCCLIMGTLLARAQTDAPAASAVHEGAIQYGVFVAGGNGTGERSGFKFLNAGVQAGYVVTREHLPGFLRGNFEYLAEVVPFWQSYTPRKFYTFAVKGGGAETLLGGGTFTGIALTPVILRWNFMHEQSRLLPWVQGGGGLLYTVHKYPLPATSVWNFEPQFGLGAHYFINARHSIDLAANAIHISNASLGDHNPGVNALVQFQLGFTWWKK